MATVEQPDQLLAQVLKLPRTNQQVVMADYIDANGHMNMMYYTMIGNFGMRNFLEKLGLHQKMFRSERRGLFALRQVISYLHELREDEEVAVHSGLVGFDAKRLHFMHYVVNLTQQRLAATDERLAMYIDLTTRRSTPFEPEVLPYLAQVQAECAALGWQPALSGAIQLRK